MYALTLNNEKLGPLEKELLKPSLLKHGLDENIWDLYDEFLETSTRYSIPQVLRISESGQLLAVVFLMKCLDHGQTLTTSPFLQNFLRRLSIPIYVWMKAGIAAENFANPGFFTDGANGFNMFELLRCIRKKLPLLFIHDKEEHAPLYAGASDFHYPDEGAIELTFFITIDDYLGLHKNLKKKLRHYNKYDGKVDILKGNLDNDLQEKIYNSVWSTSAKSLFKLPYQENYPNMCRSSTNIKNKNVIHFICRNDKDFFGYHTFIQFAKQMRCMNGAFNRELPTTHHAYENMIYKTVEYGIDKKLDHIYYGPVLNETKRRMMSTFIPTKLYLLSSIPGLNKLARPLLERSKLQNKELLKFSGLSATSKKNLSKP